MTLETKTAGDTPPIDPNPDGLPGETPPPPAVTDANLAPPPVETQTGLPDANTIDPTTGRPYQLADPRYDPYQTDTVTADGLGEYVPPEQRTHTAVETGGPVNVETGEAYTGRSGESILDGAQQGLIDMAQRDNPLMELERARGMRLAESRGLGQSSFAGRAAEGAALDKAWPMVQQAMQLESQERLAAQSLTANASIQYANRALQANLQEQQLALQAGDAAKARQLQDDMQREKNILDEYVRARDLAVQSGNMAEQRRLDEIMTRYQIQGRLNEQRERLNMQISENDLDRKFDELRQDKDIDYKKWLSDATFGHENILRSNAQAVEMYGRFTDQAMHILNNPETTSAQKNAAMTALREGLSASLIMLEGLSGLDLSQFAPAAPIVGPIQFPDITFPGGFGGYGGG